MTSLQKDNKKLQKYQNKVVDKFQTIENENEILKDRVTTLETLIKQKLTGILMLESTAQSRNENISTL